MSNTPSDEELIAELEAAGVAFMAFRGGVGLNKEIWTTSGSQDAKKIATGIRAVLAKWGTPQPAPAPLIARSLAEWHEQDGNVAWWAWNGREWAGEPAWIGTPK